MFLDIKEDFRDWLVNEKGLSVKVSRDIQSRCKRLDTEVLESIDFAISSPEFYLQALKNIRSYAIANNGSKSTQYAMTSTLRAALRKYCEYRNPESFNLYPNGYSLTKEVSS